MGDAISQLLSIIEKSFKRNSKRVEFLRLSYKAEKNTCKRVKSIGGGYKGSRAEYKEKVLSYWAKYGLKPKKYWFDLYCAGQDSYDPRYISDPIWRCKILPYFNKLDFRDAYADKGMFNRLLTDVKKPETIVKRIAGYYYNGDGEQLISREEAVKLCENEMHLIFKPSDGHEGKGIQFYDRDNKSCKSVSEIFDDLKGAFVVQHIVKQHPDLARLNASTLNTIRAISFHFNNEVYVLSAQLRIGGAGARVDNVAAGGSACSIYPNGWLHEQSVTRQSTWTDETANGIKLNTICVPNYQGIVDTIKRLHRELPYFNIIGWDFAVDEDGTPIMVEFNVRPAQNQIGGKEPTFGDLTNEVLEDVFIKKSLKDAFKR